MLPRKAGDELSGELVAQGYWQVLGKGLSIPEMDALSEMVLNRCKWFPTVAECREIMGREDYSNPFFVAKNHDRLTANGYAQIGPPAKQIGAA